MTGLYDGMGELILLSIWLLIYVPAISTVVLAETGLFANTPVAAKIMLYGITFIVLFLLTLFIIRNFPAGALDGLTAYALIMTVAEVVHRSRKRKRSGKKDTRSSDVSN